MHSNKKKPTDQTQQSPGMVILDFIRHGEPEGGTRYRGSQDDPLSPLGWQQLRSSTQQALTQGAQWQEVIASPMLRCSRFAHELSEQHNLPITEQVDLRELSFGDLEGLTPQAAWDKYPTLLANMWKNPEAHTPPNGEPFIQFSDRVERSLKNIILKHLAGTHKKTPHLLLIVHGGTIRAMLHRLLGIPASATFQFDVPYAAITRIIAYKDDDTFTVSLKNLNGVVPVHINPDNIGPSNISPDNIGDLSSC